MQSDARRLAVAEAGAGAVAAPGAAEVREAVTMTKASGRIRKARVDESVDENGALMSSVLGRSSSRRNGMTN